MKSRSLVERESFRVRDVEKDLFYRLLTSPQPMVRFPGAAGRRLVRCTGDVKDIRLVPERKDFAVPREPG